MRADVDLRETQPGEFTLTCVSAEAAEALRAFFACVGDVEQDGLVLTVRMK